MRNYTRLMGQENRLIANMDETPLWADISGNSTLNAVGDRDVPMRTTGHGKERFTVSLCALADGTKLPPQIIFKGKRNTLRDEDIPRGLVVHHSDSGWQTAETMKKWANQVWTPFSEKRRVLTLDLYSSHRDGNLLRFLKTTCNTQFFNSRCLHLHLSACGCVMEQAVQDQVP